MSGIQRNKGKHLGTPAKHQQGLAGEKRLRLPPGARRTMLPPPPPPPPPAVIPGTPVVPAEGGTTGVSGIQRNKGKHLGTPAKHQQGLAGEKRLRLPPGTRRTMLPPPAVILGTPVVPAEGGTTGVSGIQRNKGKHLGTPAKHQTGLTGEKRLRLPPGTRRAMLPLPPSFSAPQSSPLSIPKTWFTLYTEDMVYTFPEGMVSTCSANGLSMGSTLHPSSSK